MRALLQRVKIAKVFIEEKLYSEIKNGLLIFLGVEKGDDAQDLQWLVNKISQLRIFSDDQNKMNLNILESQGEIMVVSQFTLFASTKKGNRPGFSQAAEPSQANEIYNEFMNEMSKKLNQDIKSGKFAADMQIELINDGPVTIWIDTKNKE
jgi:D-tyrosyl-tRNA(Tyr) deacylase